LLRPGRRELQAAALGLLAEISLLLDRLEALGPASGVSNCLSQALDLCWRSPESGDGWYKSRELKKTICCHFEGWRLLDRLDALGPASGARLFSNPEHQTPNLIDFGPVSFLLDKKISLLLDNRFFSSL
jgi:hypothetical protein